MLPTDFHRTTSFDNLKPTYYYKLAGDKLTTGHMPLTPFALPRRKKTELALEDELWPPPSRVTVVVSQTCRRGWTDEGYTGISEWERRSRCKLSMARSMRRSMAPRWKKTQLSALVPSALTPHRFSFDPTNLCSLMPDHGFPSFSSPSLYEKTPDSFCCLHVEQLFAPSTLVLPVHKWRADEEKAAEWKQLCN